MGKLFKAFVGFGILCIVVIYIIFGPYMLVRSINDVIQYHQDKDCVIELPAVVTDIDDSVGSEEENVIFGGRLGLYKYMDMHHVVAEALKMTNELL